MRPALRCTLAAAAIAAPGAAAPPAVAHGPCRCLDPVLPQQGARVHVVAGYPAYRIVFNPRPRDLGIAPMYLASAHRADVPATTVLSRPRRRPVRRARFRVPPDTPPGLYLVLIFDGEEGGFHNTWDYVHVVDRDRTRARGVVARDGGRPVPRDDGRALGGAARVALVAAGAAVVALGAFALRRRRARELAPP